MRLLKLAVIILGLFTIHLTKAQVNENSTYNLDPIWSPDSQKIAFTSNQAGEGDIWIVQADGTNSQNLTATLPGDAALPAWSPDGSKIAFVSNLNDQSSLWVMNMDGSNPVKLSPEDAQAVISYPEWSPNGQQLIFATFKMQPVEYLLWITDIEGSQLRLFGSGYMPEWSPNGEWIAFYTLNQELNLDIGLIKPDGSALQIFEANTPMFFSSMVWSPDSQWLAFNTRTEPILNNVGNLWLIDVTTMVKSQLTNDLKIAAFRWSPDSTRLLVRQEKGIMGSEIWMVQADGTNQYRFIEWTDATAPYTPEWSQANNQVIFGAATYKGSLANRIVDIWLVDAGGVNRVNLTLNIEAPAGYPKWSPDGSKIAFTTGRISLIPPSFMDNIWVMNADGSGQLQLTHNEVAQ